MKGDGRNGRIGGVDYIEYNRNELFLGGGIRAQQQPEPRCGCRSGHCSGGPVKEGAWSRGG